MAPKGNNSIDTEATSKNAIQQPENKPEAEVMQNVDVETLVERCLKLSHYAIGKQTDTADVLPPLLQCQTASFNEHQQIFVGIAGTPGSGKSFIAHQVCDEINRRNPNGDADAPECVVVGMDGYHHTRKQLKEMAESGHKFKVDHLEDGKFKVKNVTMEYEELMARRGAAFTYCPDSFIRDLGIIKKTGQGSFPEYSREKHDPVPDGVKVQPSNKIILVEGLYLLCLNDPDWQPLRDLWDDTWLIDVSLPETKRRLVKRHLKTWDDRKTEYWGGDDEAAATRKAEANDLINAKCIQENSRDFANLIIKNETIPEDDSNNADCEAA
ncbi:unnamed protein product [Cylindrotheca closterium]|uniref:Phosphoribulokinase/uridine kinase domain-containing protein n=1 Tax=Cylindrotheca closterium TaxID=2856 RepID=A0AAD2G5X4_9STRA|nr:unnamed protein product [Cylindrotheca closterium]